MTRMLSARSQQAGSDCFRKGSDPSRTIHILPGSDPSPVRPGSDPMATPVGWRPRRTGQTLTEYALIIGVVLAAVTGMQTYIKRGIQSSLKVAADQIGDQQRGLQYEAGDRVGSVPGTTPTTPGTVLEQQSATRSYTRKDTAIREKEWGGSCSDTAQWTKGGNCKEYKATAPNAIDNGRIKKGDPIADRIDTVGALDPKNNPKLPRDLAPGSSSYSVVIHSRTDQ